VVTEAPEGHARTMVGSVTIVFASFVSSAMYGVPRYGSGLCLVSCVGLVQVAQVPRYYLAWVVLDLDLDLIRPCYLGAAQSLLPGCSGQRRGEAAQTLCHIVRCRVL
jgi:hypothetical protein